MKFSSRTSRNLRSILLPTAYLPPISYISECLKADEIWLENHETYPKQTIRNHCVISGPNGRQVLSIPVHKPEGNHTKTKDIRLSDSGWQKMHWRSILTAYSNSPYFLYYMDLLVPMFEKKQEFLVDFNELLLNQVLSILKTEKQLKSTNHFDSKVDNLHDYRFLWVKKTGSQTLNFPEYTQVFSGRNGFIADASIIDLIFNMGPEAFGYLAAIQPENLFC